MRIVSLAESATDFGGQAKVESHSKRLQRLFRSFEIGRDSLARPLARLLPRLVPWRLAIDRTSRPFRKTDIDFPVSPTGASPYR